jgi:hypothetical protein
MGFLNGLSAMGASTAAFASAAGLEQQKADLAQQSLTLADSLAGARETAGRTQAGDIAAAAATQAQQATATNLATSEAGATARTAATNTTSLGVAGIAAQSASAVEATRAASAQSIASAGLAQNKPLIDAQVAEVQTKTGISDMQAGQMKTSLALQTQIADESAKPDPDPTKISALQSQYKGLNYNPQVQAAVLTAADGMATTSQAAVTALYGREATLVTQLNSAEIQEGAKAALQSTLDDVRSQIVIAKGRADYFAKTSQGQMSSVTGTSPPGVAPTAPTGVPAGSRYSPSMKIWQGPDGSLFDATGKPTKAPGQAAPVPAGTGLINSGAAGTP